LRFWNGFRRKTDLLTATFGILPATKEDMADFYTNLADGPA
jgi:hypothetical protein